MLRKRGPEKKVEVVEQKVIHVQWFPIASRFVSLIVVADSCDESGDESLRGRWPALVLQAIA